MPKPFKEASYLSQVRRLRNLAKKAIALYPLKAKVLFFLNHGENTTFRVQTTNGDLYLLRIHRNDYHTKSAIGEEMAWLSHLAKKGFSVPKPVYSKKKNLVETVEGTDVGHRNCSVFHWIPGGFIRKSIRPHHLFQVGQMIGDFQSHGPRKMTKERKYWTADGLLGSSSKFGSIDDLRDASPAEQISLLRARKSVLKRLRHFENRFPDRLGLIHADLHFGNIVSSGKTLGAIDFDDCGYGFFAYDLVIPYLSLQNLLGEAKKHQLPEYRKALFDGYKTKKDWDYHDEEIFPYLVMARKLLMLAWLNSRSDNPRLRKHLKKAIKSALLQYKTMV